MGDQTIGTLDVEDLAKLIGTMVIEKLMLQGQLKTLQAEVSQMRAMVEEARRSMARPDMANVENPQDL